MFVELSSLVLPFFFHLVDCRNFNDEQSSPAIIKYIVALEPIPTKENSIRADGSNSTKDHFCAFGLEQLKTGRNFDQGRVFIADKLPTIISISDKYSSIYFR